MPTQKVTVKRRVKKGSANSDKPPKGMHKCPSCGGTGLKMNTGRYSGK